VLVTGGNEYSMTLED
jgi:hypothetical protein